MALAPSLIPEAFPAVTLPIWERSRGKGRKLIHGKLRAKVFVLVEDQRRLALLLRELDGTISS
jgi:hypothetical protein